MAVGGNSKNGRKGSYVISINIFWRNVEEAAILAFSERKANTLLKHSLYLDIYWSESFLLTFCHYILNFFWSNLLLKGMKVARAIKVVKDYAEICTESEVEKN